MGKGKDVDVRGDAGVTIMNGLDLSTFMKLLCTFLQSAALVKF